MFTRLANEGLWLILILSLLPLLASLVVGLVVSLFQALTQIQEQTLSYVPKLILVFLSIALLGPWMLAQAAQFTRVIFDLGNHPKAAIHYHLKSGQRKI